jgi:hypothetical protein
MRRFPHGATCRPPELRPGGGFGRPPGRPGPVAIVLPVLELEPEWFIDATAYGRSLIELETVDARPATEPATPYVDDGSRLDEHLS